MSYRELDKVIFAMLLILVAAIAVWSIIMALAIHEVVVTHVRNDIAAVLAAIAGASATAYILYWAFLKPALLAAKSL